MKRYVFDRLHFGQRMAEQIAVHASNMTDALLRAQSIADPLDELRFDGLKKCPKRNEQDIAKGLQCLICYPTA